MDVRLRLSAKRAQAFPAHGVGVVASHRLQGDAVAIR